MAQSRRREWRNVDGRPAGRAPRRRLSGISSRFRRRKWSASCSPGGLISIRPSRGPFFVDGSAARVPMAPISPSTRVRSRSRRMATPRCWMCWRSSGPHRHRVSVHRVVRVVHGADRWFAARNPAEWRCPPLRQKRNDHRNLGTPSNPHPLQQAFVEMPSGSAYCLSGILISARALLDRNLEPTRAPRSPQRSMTTSVVAAHIHRILRAVARAAVRVCARRHHREPGNPHFRAC